MAACWLTLNALSIIATACSHLRMMQIQHVEHLNGLEKRAQAPYWC